MVESTLKKIAILLPSLKFGGAERVALTLAEALQNSGCRVDVLLMSKEGEFLAEAETKFRVIDLECDRTYKLPAKLVQYLLLTRPDMLLSSFWKLNLCACIAKIIFPRVTLLLWEHSMPSKSPNSPKWIFAISASIFYRMANRIVAVSSGVFHDIDRITIGLRRKLIVIGNPIRPPQTSRLQRVDSPLPREFEIISVGRMDENKNHRLLIEAFSILAKKRSARLTIVGDGSTRAALQLYCSVLGLDSSVRFLGFHPTPYDIMAASDLLVVTSQHEGLPSVVIEAMYCGLGIVSTDCGGIYDIFDGGSYGRIVPRNDPQALAAAIEAELMEKRPSQIQQAGAERFLPQIVAKNFLALMKKI